MIRNKEISLVCISNTNDSGFCRLKLAVLGQNWKESNCLRHQLSAPLDVIYGSKAIEKTLLENRGKKKVKRSYNLFNATIFDFDKELGEPPR